MYNNYPCSIYLEALQQLLSDPETLSDLSRGPHCLTLYPDGSLLLVRLADWQVMPKCPNNFNLQIPNIPANTSPHEHFIKHFYFPTFL